MEYLAEKSQEDKFYAYFIVTADDQTILYKFVSICRT